MEDSEILQLLLDRSDKATEAMTQRFGKLLHRIALNILPDHRDAEECVSDTYLALWNSIPPARPLHLEAYACRTLRNIISNRLRSTGYKASRSMELSLEELAESLPGKSLDEDLDARELGRAINGFLDTQTPENKAIFIRRYYLGEKLETIALAVGRSENTVSVLLHKLRRQLRSYLAKEGFYHE